MNNDYRLIKDSKLNNDYRLVKDSKPNETQEIKTGKAKKRELIVDGEFCKYFRKCFVHVSCGVLP